MLGEAHWTRLNTVATSAVATSKPSFAVRANAPSAARWAGREPAVSGIARAVSLASRDGDDTVVGKGGAKPGATNAPGSHDLPSGAGNRGELRSAARRAPRRQEPSLLA